MSQHVAGSIEGPNAAKLIRGRWSSLPARRILLEGGLLLAMAVCFSCLVRW